MSNEQMYLEFTTIATEDTKVCIYCSISKPLEDFPRHVHHKDNLDSRCKECVKKQAKIRNELKKTAPEKPETCECCRKKTDKWVLDHDHSNDTFRGWVCDACNTGIGKLGDNIDGIVNALNYLLSREKND